MFNIPKEVLEGLRKEYPKGCRVELLHMDDPYTKLKPGDKGTVMGVDDIGTIHVSWDCGSSLGVAYGEDSCRKLDSVTVICYGETKVWDSRKEAERFFIEGFAACEGSERERYAKILLNLAGGRTICRDSEESEKEIIENECDFCSANQEWEDVDNGFFMELRLDSPWHELHINLGHESLKENDITIDLNFCPVCGRKLI